MNTVQSLLSTKRVWPLRSILLSLTVAVQSLYAVPNGETLFQITPPVELSRLANEWEPQQALILSVSFPEAMEDLEIARNFVSVLDAAHPYLDIYVFCEQEKHKEYAHFLSLIHHHPRVEAIMEKTHFIDSRSLLRWARDFGPIFGFGSNNQLVTIDMVYRDPMKSLEEEALQLDEPLDPLRDFFNLHGDAMPAEVAALLEFEYEIPVDIVRPRYLWMGVISLVMGKETYSFPGKHWFEMVATDPSWKACSFVILGPRNCIFWKPFQAGRSLTSI